MPLTIEHIAEVHRLASKRRAEGKPVWDMTLSIQHLLNDDSNDEMAAITANKIAAAIRATVPPEWLDGCHDNWDEKLDEIVIGMEALKPDSYDDDPDFSPLEDLNNMLDELYDWADLKRVWIA